MEQEDSRARSRTWQENHHRIETELQKQWKREEKDNSENWVREQEQEESEEMNEEDKKNHTRCEEEGRACRTANTTVHTTKTLHVFLTVPLSCDASVCFFPRQIFTQSVEKFPTA